jgi:hypothetical protein
MLHGFFVNLTKSCNKTSHETGLYKKTLTNKVKTVNFYQY